MVLCINRAPYSINYSCGRQKIQHGHSVLRFPQSLVILTHSSLSRFVSSELLGQLYQLIREEAKVAQMLITGQFLKDAAIHQYVAISVIGSNIKRVMRKNQCPESNRPSPPSSGWPRGFHHDN
jgi:hypothetical protein